MNFNLEKYHVLHVGSSNPETNYSMDNVQLTNVVKEKGLGVIVSNDLKPELQCAEVLKTANKLVSFIGRVFKFKSEKIIPTLYNSLVRPHLEYCVQFWSSYYHKDIDKLDRIQHRITKIIQKLRNKPHDKHFLSLYAD